MGLVVRYDMADPEGETRRERNERFFVDSPEVEVPEDGYAPWRDFWQINRTRRTGDSPEPLSYGDIQAWLGCTGRVVTPEHIDMLIAMDERYRSAAAEEIRSYRKRKEQK